VSYRTRVARRNYSLGGYGLGSTNGPCPA